MTSALAIIGTLALAWITLRAIESGKAAAHAQRFDLRVLNEENPRKPILRRVK